jgi:hypothetical protein
MTFLRTIRRNDDPPDDGPCVTEISTTLPRALKQYSCHCCSALIEKGERHRKIVLTNDEALRKEDRFLCVRMHLFCPLPQDY